MEAGTRLTNEADLEGRGIAKFAGPLVSGSIRGVVATNLGKLRDLLEA
jgi:hypothetical protein